MNHWIDTTGDDSEQRRDRELQRFLRTMMAYGYRPGDIPESLDEQAKRHEASREAQEDGSWGCGAFVVSFIVAVALACLYHLGVS